MNKLIVVTGGTKGIGRAILAKFAAGGFDILTCSRTKADLDKLVDDFKKSYPKSQCYDFVADMAQKSQLLGYIGVPGKINGFLLP